MGIKTRNVDEVILTLHVPGTLTTGVNKVCAYVPFPGFLKNIYAKLDVPGTGVTATTVDINLDAVSIHSSTAISLAATTGVATHGAYSTDPTPVAAGQILSLDIDGIAVAAKNLCVTVVVSKRDPSATAHAADLR